MRWRQPLLYVWASPATAIGLSLAPIVLYQGGTMQWARGVIEIQGGVVTALLNRGLLGGPAAAMTLGHVVWGCDQRCLDRTRAHELVHVRQYERWGPFFIPAYLLASLIAHLRGGNAYLDNPFEREAFEQAP
jgi:hypothetical protein